MRRGLLTLLFASAVYAGPYEDFQSELIILNKRTKVTHSNECDVHIKIKEVIGFEVKQYYEKERNEKDKNDSRKSWYMEIDALNKAVQENYSQNFGICIDIVCVEEWKHEPSLTLETLMQEAMFIPPKEAQAVVGLTRLKALLTSTVGRAEPLGNYMVIRVGKEDGRTIYLHEFAHLLGAQHVNDQKSIMYEQESGSLHWDRTSKKIIISNKNRSWELDETKVGLHKCALHLDEKSLKQLKSIYRLFGLQNLVQDKHKLWQTAEERTSQLLASYPKEGHLHFLQSELYEQLGKNEESMGELEKALAFGTDYAVLQNNLAYYYSEKNPERALKLAQSAVNKKPNDEFRETLGWAYYNNGCYNEAEQELIKIKSLEKNAEYQYHLGMTYDKLNKWEKAKDALRKVITLDKGKLRQFADKKLKAYEYEENSDEKQNKDE